MRASGGTPTSAPADVEVGAAWRDAPCPVLVVGRDGRVVGINAAARLLLPEAAPGQALSDRAPSWLADAHRRHTDAGPPDELSGLGRLGDFRGPGSGDLGGPGDLGLPEDLGEPAAHAAGLIGDRFYEAHPSRSTGGTVVWWLIDDDRRLAETALHNARERSALLAEISSTLLSTLNVPRCAEVAARMAAEHLAEAAVLIAPSQGRRHPLTLARRGGPVVQVTRRVDPADVPGLAEALRGFPPVPARWIDPGDLPDWVIPPDFTGRVGSVIVTPLPGHGVPAGALVLLRSATDRAFSPDEEVFSRLFAARAGAALSAARMYTEQASVTATLMRELLPPALHGVHGVEYAGYYRAAKDQEQVGGDFYDVHPSADPSGETLVVLGDVAGKGLEAAVLTGKIRNTLHALLPLAADHERVLNLLNGALLSSHHTRFATIVLASVRRRGDRVRLRLTGAGHPRPLILRADGSVEAAPTYGTLVGALPTVTARTVETELAPGETCVLYTDGVTEARGGPLGDDLFGEHRLEQALAGCAGMPAEAVVERVQMLASQWVGAGRHDDMATVAVSAARTAPPSFAPADGGDSREGDE
ncbi:PP2C family protein-serine/threonine phosphatase [Streptomyces sp. NPDC046985]|uniref:PP2C family protein-serine/threonine phosphatase n=1 Tax=Streptomyces sp. NPDC046985 TaxID=3155377 RepID=UPI0033FEEAF0